MSDFHYERVTCEEVVRRAHGDVLIAGLGLGMILHPILKIEAVRSVTVIEKYQDVMDLVLPTLAVNDKLQVVVGDICTWKPPRGRRYDVIWFDIWPDIEPTRLPEMTRLHRRYRRWLNRANPDCWMESWHRRETRSLARAQKNAERKIRLLLRRRPSMRQSRGSRPSFTNLPFARWNAKKLTRNKSRSHPA